jgi:hypothetical protein
MIPMFELDMGLGGLDLASHSHIRVGNVLNFSRHFQHSDVAGAKSWPVRARRGRQHGRIWYLHGQWDGLWVEAPTSPMARH